MEDRIRTLYETIQQRKETPIADSYTNYLFAKGEDKILKKVGEECTEVIIAAKKDDNKELVKEVVDLTYHCLVLLVEKGISLEDICNEMKERSGKLSKVGERSDINLL
ncbi:phosphoribosyl-ATP diphosphatase [Bacillus manliponensis]|uniref:phosphoribosyl-ATP diphosphatase n=1 Tax=Bacillus manliponensis TaxID=574376 RepID=UPI0035151DD5